MSQSVPLRRLFAQEQFRRWAVANLLARLPLTMNLLVLVLVGEALTGQVSTGATLAGGATLAAGLAAQWRGRRLDTVELNRGLRGDMLLSSLSLFALCAATVLGAPVPVMLGLSVLLGIAFAAVLGGFRALLVQSVPEDDIEAANAMDAVFVEVAFVLGPAMAALLALLIPPAGLLLLMGLTFAAAIPVTATLPTRQPAAAGAEPVGPLPLLTHGGNADLPVGGGRRSGAGVLRVVDSGPRGGIRLRARVSRPLPRPDGTRQRDRRGGRPPTGRTSCAGCRLYAATLFFLLSVLFVPVAATGTVWVLAVAMLLLGAPLAPLNALGSFALSAHHRGGAAGGGVQCLHRRDPDRGRERTVPGRIPATALLVRVPAEHTSVPSAWSSPSPCTARRPGGAVRGCHRGSGLTTTRPSGSRPAYA